jgi:site-specific DNA recombinase
MSRQLTAVLYLRVSFRRQVEGTSLATQEATCREWCRRHGMTVDNLFVDRGESAKTTDRPAFQEMMRYLHRSKGRWRTLSRTVSTESQGTLKTT